MRSCASACVRRCASSAALGGGTESARGMAAIYVTGEPAGQAPPDFCVTGYFLLYDLRRFAFGPRIHGLRKGAHGPYAWGGQTEARGMSEKLREALEPVG